MQEHSIHQQISFGSHTISNTNTSESEIFLAKSDADGSWLWASSAGGTERDTVLDLAFSSDGLLYAVGEINDQAQFGDYYLSSTNSQSSAHVTTISANNGTWMSAISLHSTNDVRITGITGSLDDSITITGNFIGSLNFGTITR